MFKKIMAASASFLCVGLIIPTGMAKSKGGKQPLNCRSAIAADEDTGQILYQKNSKKSLPTASMSKLVTSYIVLQRIAKHQLSWKQKVSVSKPVANLSRKPGMTNVLLEAGKKYSVASLYSAGLIGSANAAEVALGDHISGNQQKFARLMNKTVKDLGIKGSQFNNACGLTNGDLGKAGTQSETKKKENKMSALGMAILSQKLLKQYPQILNTTKKTKYEFKEGKNKKTIVKTSNLLLPGQSENDSQFLVDGLKTGESGTAKGNFTGTELVKNRRIITVVMGTPTNSRFAETKKLLGKINNNWQPVEKTFSASKLKVADGEPDWIDVAPKHPYLIWLKNETGNSLSAPVQINKKYRSGNRIAAPVKKGQLVANLNPSQSGVSNAYLYAGEGQVPLYTDQEVKQIGWLNSLFNGIKKLFALS